MTSTLTIGLEDGKQPKNIEINARILDFIDGLLRLFFISVVVIADAWVRRFF